MIREVLGVAAIAMATGVAQAADGYDAGERRSIAVAAADLDLSTSAGIAELYRRVDRAVDRICDGDRDCGEEAWESTQVQAASAIARDRYIRRLAREREAELRACGRGRCAVTSAYYQSLPALPPGGIRVTVTVQTAGPGYYGR